MNRAEMVYQYMKDYGSITPMDAIADLGYTRLACAISELKKGGCPVRKVNETRKNRRGNHVTYARYFLAGERNADTVK